MVLAVLAVIWGVVLIPPYLRSRAESRPGDSIGSFRRQLGVLQRTAPLAISPAHRLNGRSVARGPALPAGLGRVRMAPLSVANPAHAVHYGPVAPGGQMNGPLARPYAVSSARRRRREVFKALLVAMGGTLVLGAIPALRGLWAVHVVVDLAFIGYVALLVRLRNVAAEREMKVRLLPRVDSDMLAALRIPEPAYVSAGARRAVGE